MPAPPSADKGRSLLPMSVDDISFLLDRLGQDCHPLQFLRELTQNSIESIARTDIPGEIVWDVDWTTYDLTGVRKLSIVDTGDGMTGDEMIRFINQLSSSVGGQSMTGNYGVGAKITAATRNHAGVVYCSWKDGQGAMIHLYRDSVTGQYGLKQWERGDGSYQYSVEITDDVKPDIIDDHGTLVVLYGSDEKADTLLPPEGSASPSRWVTKYLNTRYYQLPDCVTLRAREGWDYPRSDGDRNYMRKLTGQKEYLGQHSSASGVADLTGASVRWWILKDEPALTNNSGFVESSGHIAALYQGELYEMSTARAGMARLQQFGVTFGHRQVVIYIEPSSAPGVSITTNTARTNLLVNSEPLPWSTWAAEFRENMPEEIAELVEEKAAGAAGKDHASSIKDRLKELLRLYKVSRYKPTEGGGVLIDDENVVHGGRSSSGGTTGQGNSGGRTRESGRSTGEEGNVYSLFEKEDGSTEGKAVKSDPFPRVRWVRVSEGTREPGNIEDRAARYIPDQNLLLINGDFRAFSDMVAFFTNEFGEAAGVKGLVEDAVCAWFEQALTEAVMGVNALRNSKEWSVSDIDRAISEEALTTAVMQRYHVVFAVRRQLGSRLGGKKTRAA